MVYTSSEHSFCESAISSTFVATPFSGQVSLLKQSHTQIQAAAGNHIARSGTTLFKPPQPPILQQFHSFVPNCVLPMFQPQVEGKGPIQPHITNLPRRKGRRPIVNATEPRRVPATHRLLNSSSNVRDEIQNRTTEPIPNPKPRSSSAESVLASSASSPSPSPSPSPCSSSPLPSHSHRFNRPTPNHRADGTLTSPSPSVREAKRTLALTGAVPPLSLSNSLPQPKGHIEPHITNIPRRKRPLNYSRRPEPPLEQVKERHRKVWERRKCLEEIGGTEGVWVTFDDAGIPAGADTDEEGELEVGHRVFEKEFEEEFSGGWAVRVCHSEAGEVMDVVESGNVLKLYVHRSSIRDDGIPHLSREQILFSREFIARFYSTNVSSTPSLSSTSSYTSVSTTLNSDDSSTRRHPKLLITVPRRCQADAMALIVVVLLALESKTVSSSSSGSDPEPLTHIGTLSLLARLYDMWDLSMAWRGALSCDGVDWLDEMLDVRAAHSHE